MVRMGDVWDRTVTVLQGRGGMLAGIAALAVFLPAVVRAAAQAYADLLPPWARGVLGLIMIAALVVSVWGHLAILAAASDPAVLRSDASRMATRRLLPALGLLAIVGVAVAVLIVPLVFSLVGAGVDPQAMMRSGIVKLTPQTARFVLIYMIAFVVVGLVAGARLILLYPVVLLEQDGLRSFARSFRLTRGLTWRLIGVLLLYTIVILVAGGAAQLIVGTLAALVLGAGGTAAFITAVAGALVAAGFSVVAIVFTAQLYIATHEAPFLS